METFLIFAIPLGICVIVMTIMAKVCSKRYESEKAIILLSMAGVMTTVMILGSLLFIFVLIGNISII